MVGAVDARPSLGDRTIIGSLGRSRQGIPICCPQISVSHWDTVLRVLR